MTKCTIKEMSELLDVTPQTIWRWRKYRGMPHEAEVINTAHVVWFDLDAVLAWAGREVHEHDVTVEKRLRGRIHASSGGG